MAVELSRTVRFDADISEEEALEILEHTTGEVWLRSGERVGRAALYAKGKGGTLHRVCPTVTRDEWFKDISPRQALDFCIQGLGG